MHECAGIIICEPEHRIKAQGQEFRRRRRVQDVAIVVIYAHAAVSRGLDASFVA